MPSPQGGKPPRLAALRFVLVLAVSCGLALPVLWQVVPRAGEPVAAADSRAEPSEDLPPAPVPQDLERLDATVPSADPEVPPDTEPEPGRSQVAVPQGAPVFEPGQTSERELPTTADATEVSIPSIGAHSSLVDLGLNPDGTMQVPQEFSRAGLYTGGVQPGQRGPAIIAGHVDSHSGPAVFYRLRELEPGDEIQVTREDGSEVTFVVDRVEQFDKDVFPTDQVYSRTLEPELRLITCAGDFDPELRSYRDNFIVFASLLN